MYAPLLFFQVVAWLGQSAQGGDIINGEKAPENAFLYMASIQNNGGHICGGFLISEDFVLTAAHCDDDPTRVVVGTHNLKNVDDDNIRYIERRYKHEYYTFVGNGYDIMLLKLSRKVQVNNRLQIIHLPSAGKHIWENEVCHVAGWGYTKTGDGTVDDLRVVDVSVINLRICKEAWHPHPIPDNVICAGGYDTKKGFCQGDSGGPLVCNGKAVGIVSFNYRGICDYPDKPNIYTDVSKYLPWIKSIVNHGQRFE